MQVIILGEQGQAIARVTTDPFDNHGEWIREALEGGNRHPLDTAVPSDERDDIAQPQVLHLFILKRNSHPDIVFVRLVV